MISGWLGRLRARREQRIVQRRAISDALWLDTLASLPFLARWSVRGVHVKVKQKPRNTA